MCMVENSGDKGNFVINNWIPCVKRRLTTWFSNLTDLFSPCKSVIICRVAR